MEIIGYNNYLIYPDGKVQNKNTKRYLKPGTHKNGYKYVNLCKNGKYKSYRIHRLVALHYIPNPDNLPQVDHWNGKRNDNRLENLRWVTPSENCQNTGTPITNTSGHKNLSYHKTNKAWRYYKEYRGVRIQKYFKTKTEALCYKYIIILKILAKI